MSNVNNILAFQIRDLLLTAEMGRERKRREGTSLLGDHVSSQRETKHALYRIYGVQQTDSEELGSKRTRYGQGDEFETMEWGGF